MSSNPSHARLVALGQVSSATVERVFSQVQLICETTGVMPLEGNMQVRLFERLIKCRLTGMGRQDDEHGQAIIKVDDGGPNLLRASGF